MLEFILFNQHVTHSMSYLSGFRLIVTCLFSAWPSCCVCICPQIITTLKGKRHPFQLLPSVYEELYLHRKYKKRRRPNPLLKYKSLTAVAVPVIGRKQVTGHRMTALHWSDMHHLNIGRQTCIRLRLMGN